MKIRHQVTLLATAGSLIFNSANLCASDLDDRIESVAKKSHVFRTHLKGDSIKTVSQDGVVTLTGTVSDTSHKNLAQDTVENISGVRRVDNQLVIKEEGPKEHSDGWISAKVKMTLLFHRNVSGSTTDVFVKDGIVSLRGEASSEAQKELTAEYAMDVEGVKEVKNELTIAKTPLQKESVSDKIDDASITAHVKSVLMSHRSTSAVKTKVETRSGVVNLTGIAKNDAEKSLVTKLVSDVMGVTSVVNEMTVATPINDK
jgi:osmotically-inducible protein OsmY